MFESKDLESRNPMVVLLKLDTKVILLFIYLFMFLQHSSRNPTAFDPHSLWCKCFHDFSHFTHYEFQIAFWIILQLFHDLFEPLFWVSATNYDIANR